MNVPVYPTFAYTEKRLKKIEQFMYHMPLGLSPGTNAFDKYLAASMMRAMYVECFE